MNDHSTDPDDTEEPIRTVDGWAATLGLQFAQAQGWVSAARLTEQKYLREQQDAISQFRQALMLNAATLELVQYPTTERWECPLPKDWTKTLYIKQSALRRWANAHRPDWLNLPALHAAAPRAVHHPDAAGRIASLARMPDTTALSVRDWIDNLTLELCQERGMLDPRWHSLREQFADMFDFADKAQLPLVRDGGVQWPPAKPLPADWHDVLFIPKGALRTWVATNQPNLLEAMILSSSPHPTSDISPESTTVDAPERFSIDSEEMRELAISIANQVARRKLNAGIQQISIREVAGAVTSELAKDFRTHGQRGPCGESTVRKILRGWTYNGK